MPFDVEPGMSVSNDERILLSPGECRLDLSGNKLWIEGYERVGGPFILPSSPQLGADQFLCRKDRIAQALSKQASVRINSFACGCCSVLKQPGASAVECRSTRFVLSGYTCHILPRRDGSRELSNPENDKEAISVGDICTVVSGGVMNWASRMSSNPMTDKSRGILRERSNAARITPMAVMSFEQSTAEGRSGMAVRAEPLYPLRSCDPHRRTVPEEALSQFPSGIFRRRICAWWQFSTFVVRR